MEVIGQRHGLVALPTKNNPITHEMEVGWAIETARKFLRIEKSVPTRIRTPCRPVRNLVATPTTLSRLSTSKAIFLNLLNRKE
jgi:hypothetical protein